MAAPLKLPAERANPSDRQGGAEAGAILGGIRDNPRVAPAVECCGLTKDFPAGLRGLKVRAVERLNLFVAQGSVHALMGPNGSGKSTVLKIIVGLLRPGSGTCRIFGLDSSDPVARRAVGYLPDADAWPGHLTGRELLRLHGRLGGLDRTALPSRLAEVLDLVGLESAADRRLGTYSRGMRQRIGFAQALIHDPRLLVLDEPTMALDEPTMALDPAGIAEFGAVCGRLRARSKTILLTSHLAGQVGEICDRITLLERGRVVLEDDVAELTGGAGCERMVDVTGLDPGDLADLGRWLATRGVAARLVDRHRNPLERVLTEHLARSGAGLAS